MRSFLLSMLAVLLLASACTSAPTATQAPIDTGYPEPEASPTVETAAPAYPSPEATAQPTPEAHTPTEAPTSVPSPAGYTIAYITTDGNLWVKAGEAAPGQLTTDAVKISPANPNPDSTTVYQHPKWSSDGNLLAFIRETSKVISQGYDYHWDMMVMDTQTGQVHSVIADQQLLGFAWKPGSHEIAYTLSIPTDFFINGDTEGISGVKLVNADTGVVTDLVQPERDIPLASPVWSPDGKIIAFAEIRYMEGRGDFAYYDLDAGEYHSWEEPIGHYVILPGGDSLVFDTLTYMATGAEQVFTGGLDGIDEPVQISQAVSPAFAHYPALSPDGSKLAYLLSSDNLDSVRYEVMVSGLDGSSLTSLGSWENPTVLAWSPDGKYLVISQGPYDNAQIIEINARGGESRQIASGSDFAIK